MTLQEMIDEEKKEGYEEGRAEEKKAIAEKMKKNGLSDDLIAKIID